MNGGGRGDKDKNKQLKALWHGAKTAWRLFAVESWGLLPWLISGCPGGRGWVPRLLTHNPLQTPLLKPLVVDNSTVRKGGRPLYLLLLSSSILCIAPSVYLPPHTGLLYNYKVWTDVPLGKCINPLELRTLPSVLALSIFFDWVSGWRHIKLCLALWLCSVDWCAVAHKVRTKTREYGKRDREAEKECLEKTLPKIR